MKQKQTTKYPAHQAKGTSPFYITEDQILPEKISTASLTYTAVPTLFFQCLSLLLYFNKLKTIFRLLQINLKLSINGDFSPKLN